MVPWGEVGAVLIVLVIVFAVGNLWFHLIEGILGGLKRLFHRRREPTVWHTLPLEKDGPDKEN